MSTRISSSGTPIDSRRGNSTLPFFAVALIIFSICSFSLTYSNLESSWSSWYQDPETSGTSEYKLRRSVGLEYSNDDGGDGDDDEPALEFKPPHLHLPSLNVSTMSSMKRKQFQVNPNQTSPKGLHVCTCLTPNNPSNKNLPGTPKRLRWLHFPKTGTSFISTLWSYACSTRERYIDLAIHSHQCNIFDRSAFSMYDFALMKRYPWEIYGAPNFIPSSSSSSSSLSPKDIESMKDLPLPLVSGTQHQPLYNSVQDFRSPPSDRLKALKAQNQLRSHGSELEHNITVAAIFRQPEQRIISAFYDSRHTNGFYSDQFKDVIAQTSGPRKQGEPVCKLPDNKTYDNQLECFARYPGIAGCMARMLTGEKCADGLFQQSGFANVADAVEVIMKHLEFVGLTEEWNESICQFHRLFAGKLDKESGKQHWIPPLQGEFANVHASKTKKLLGLEHLHGFKDVADAVVYEAAKLKFERMVGSDKCYRFMSWEELEEEIWKHGDLPSFIRTDQEGNLCQPKSCSDLGKQCGEWDDGCGNTIICGICNRGRTGLPSTWRTQCVEGSCVDYCPPWDKKGYWFMSDIEKNPNTPLSITNSTLPSMKKRKQQYLTPDEAIRICVDLCARNNASEENLRKELCTCGTEPKSVLESRLSPDDFSIAHDFDTNCHKTKARAKLELLPTFTQPKCCPEYDQKSPRPEGWERMYGMMRKNLEGDYFAHKRIECGGYQECEAFGREKNAELAVFDIYNSFCYVARNVFDLKSLYAVTKDNGHRYFIDLRVDPMKAPPEVPLPVPKPHIIKNVQDNKANDNDGEKSDEDDNE